ncbi:MmgE/PrpD family protein [Chloroflexota bacterium]
MDTSYTLAKWVVDTSYEDLPPEVVAITKKSILDTIGVILAASTLGEQGVKEAIELVKDGGGKEESTVLGFGGKVPSWMAAFANGVMSHQLDYDDTYDAGPAHPGAAVLPATFALAERRGKISGRELLAAYTLGCEINCRLSLPLTRNPSEYHWLHPVVFGKFGAAPAPGRLAGLAEKQIVDAFGLVLHQANVSLECVTTPGSFMRAIRDGFTAKAAVLSVLLAQKGIEGDKNSLDGKFGLYNNCWRGDSDPAKVTAELGKRFEWANVSFKPWPCCRYTHAAIEATLNTVKKHDIMPEDVIEINLVGGGTTSNMSQGDARRKPASSIDAKLSIPYVVGVAVARRNITLQDFTPEGLSNPAALEVAQKVTHRYDQRYDKPGIESALAEITTRDGMKYSEQVDFAYGHPNNPISKEDLLDKFRDCVKYSATPLSQEKIGCLINMVDNLEQENDVSQLIQLLA